jgi:hypothetical protein
MDENKLWEKFRENGRVADYLEYRNCVNSLDKTELETLDKDNGSGARHKGTEYR